MKSSLKERIYKLRKKYLTKSLMFKSVLKRHLKTPETANKIVIIEIHKINVES